MPTARDSPEQRLAAAMRRCTRLSGPVNKGSCFTCLQLGHTCPWPL